MRMGPERPTRIALAARWLGVFSLLVLVMGTIAQRVGLSEGVAGPAVLVTACAIAVVAVLVAGVALVRIWVVGHTGVGAAFAGLAAALVVIAGPAYYAPRFLSRPPLTQVSTDLADPPAFQRALAERPRHAPDVTRIDDRMRALQTESYPDVAPLELEAPPARVFEVAQELITQRRWRILASQPPVSPTVQAPAPPQPVRPSSLQRRQPRPPTTPPRTAPPLPPSPGRIEAVARTRLYGFRDDVVLRVTGTATRSRVDMRSASRVELNDLGANARRVTDFLEALRSRIEDE
jgi:hypothetical protein